MKPRDTGHNNARRQAKFCQINYATWYCLEHKLGLDEEGICPRSLFARVRHKFPDDGLSARKKNTNV